MTDTITSPHWSLSQETYGDGDVTAEKSSKQGQRMLEQATPNLAAASVL